MSEKPELTFHVLDTAEPHEVEFIHDGLRRYNRQFADPSYSPLYVFLRNSEGALVGGLLGDVYWGWLSINILWIDEPFRGHGYGERMIGMAEDEARRRGCRHVQLDTLSFRLALSMRNSAIGSMGHWKIFRRDQAIGDII